MTGILELLRRQSRASISGVSVLVNELFLARPQNPDKGEIISE